MRRWIAIAVVAPWAAWAVGRTFGLDHVHPLIAIVAFTPYAAATAPIAIVVALVLRRWLTAAVAVGATALLVLAVLPRAYGPEYRSSDAPSVTVMTSNVLFGRADPDRIAQLVRRYRVDVLVLQELTPQEVARLDAAGLRSALPHRADEARIGGAGNAIFSRHPLRRIATERPIEPAADIAVPGFGRALRVRVVHPVPPISRGAAQAWEAHLAALPAAPRDRPGIIAGDFNATLDHRALRAVLDRGWQDAADASGDGLQPTWPVGRRIGVHIDHVLASRDLEVGEVSIHRIRGTDHRAVIAELFRPPS